MIIFCKNKTQPLWGHLSHIIILLFGVFLAAFIFFKFSNLIYAENFIQKITGATAVLNTPSKGKDMTADDMQKIIDLVDNGHVLTQDQLLATITQFYNSIINILVLIISVLGIAAYFSIRASSRNHVEEISEKYAISTINNKLEDERFINESFEKSKLFDEFSMSNTTHEEALQTLQERVSSIEYSLIMNLNNRRQQSEEVKVE